MKIKSLRQNRQKTGWIFILPWLIGFIVFFVQPLVSFLRYSFSSFVFVEGGYALNPLENGILGNYVRLFTEDADFPVLMTNCLGELLYQTPVVLFFSLFSAVVLNQKYRGKTAMRTVFFLPIIITSGVLSEIIKSDMSRLVTMSTAGSSNVFDTAVLTTFLLNSGIPEGLVTFASGLIANVADLTWKSGIQILIFLAALLGVPDSYYEVARVEGAGGWETFWKITFPIVSPFVLANLVYTIIDGFTSYSNMMMRHISGYFVQDMNYSYASAMSWSYFLMIVFLVAVVFLLVRRRVFYANK